MISKKTGHFKSFDGTKIYYESRGSGKPLVFCYGIGCLINHWRNQIKYFSEKFNVISFDYRAHHQSEIPKDDSELTIEALAKDLHCLLDHLDIPSADMISHSFGAQVLLKGYDIQPSYSNSMTFINGFASDPIAEMFGNGAASKAFNFIKNGFDLAPESISYLWKMAVNNPVSIHLSALLGGFNLNLTQVKDIEIYARGVASMDLKAFFAFFEDMMKYDGREVFAKIRVPCLIIAGQKDSITPQSYQLEMHKKIKDSQYLLVPYGSHCTQLDLPEFVNLKIEKFLESNLISLQVDKT